MSFETMGHLLIEMLKIGIFLGLMMFIVICGLFFFYMLTEFTFIKIYNIFRKDDCSNNCCKNRGDRY